MQTYSTPEVETYSHLRFYSSGVFLYYWPMGRCEWCPKTCLLRHNAVEFLEAGLSKREVVKITRFAQREWEPLLPNCREPNTGVFQIVYDASKLAIRG